MRTKVPRIEPMPLVDWSKVRIEVVGAECVRPMRREVLRPNQAPHEMVFPGDDAIGTFHLAGLDNAVQVLGVASYYQELHPHDGRAGDWRLRGMAVGRVFQGQGLGRRLIEVGLGHLRKQRGTRLWCNARVLAKPFYEKLGFRAQGEPFEIATIGPHYLMSIELA